jgi:hypothetical protein
VPPVIDPRDWDRLFAPKARRRGGPLRALAHLLVFGTVLLVLGGGGFVAVRFGLEQSQANATMTAEALSTQQAVAAATRTARSIAETATTAALLPSETPTVEEPTLGRGTVVAGGNLRREPVVADETVMGQICPGDELVFLEETTLASGAVWYRIRLTALAADCTPQRMALGSEGWASSTLLSPPSP